MELEWKLLRDAMDESGFEVRAALSLARACAKALIPLHDSFRVHARLTPDHILIASDQADTVAKLIGAEDKPEDASVDMRFLPYMAPEQTGRLHRRLDHRTDIYALGVVLYEVLTGTLPFDAREPLEWVHAHLAVAPRPITDGRVPAVMSRVIMKCLEKLPENRYQSVEGLYQDLQSGISPIGEMDQSAMLVGTADVPRALRISRKLYARDAEMDALRRTYQTAMGGGHVAVCLVGRAGMGKTALLQTFLDEHLMTGSFLAIGRANPFKTIAAFSPLSDACSALIQRFLASDDEDIRRWRALFAYFAWPQALFDLVPEFAFLAEPTRPFSHSEKLDQQELLIRSLHAFFTLIASAEHPLVIALDDLQSANVATRELVMRLVSDHTLQYILWIATWRIDDLDVEPTAGDPAVAANVLEAPWVMMHLTTVGVDAIRAMIADTLALDEEESNPLADIVHSRTMGNPFYTRQFLLELIEQRYLHFDSGLQRWHIRYDGIARMPVTQNVVDLMALQISEMPQETLLVLGWVACIGTETTVGFLAQVSATDGDAVVRSLAPAVVRGLVILTLDDQVRFIHDQAHFAIYSSIRRVDCQMMHDRIAHALMELDEDSYSRIFQIVYHLERGQKEPANRFVFAPHMLEAGLRARDAAAFSAATEYISAAYDALQESDWVENHPLMWEITRELSRCEYAQQNLQRAEQFLELSLRNAHTNEQLAAAYRMKIVWLAHMGKVEESTDVALAGLRQLGLRVRVPRTRFGLILPTLRMLWSWRLRSFKALRHLPEMTDPLSKLQMELMHSVGAPAYRVNENLMATLSLAMLRMSFQNGVSPDSPVCFSSFALVLCSGLHQHQLGRAFGLLALRTARKHRQPVVELSVYFTFATFINHWMRPFRDSLSQLRRAEELALQVGNTGMQGASASFTLFINWFIAMPLRDFKLLLNKYQPLATALTADVVISDFYEVLRSLVLILTEDQGADVAWIAFERAEPTVQRVGGAAILLACVIMRRDQDAARVLTDAQQHVRPLFATMATPEWLTLSSVMAGREARGASGFVRRSSARALRSKLRFVAGCAKSCPANYRHKEWLIRGYYALCMERLDEALHWFERAGEEAARQGVRHYAGLAFEEAGRLCLDLDRRVGAQAYVQRAMREYILWGATEKAAQLRRDLPNWVMAVTDRMADGVVASTMEQFSRELDLDVIIDVTRSISEEVVLDKLLRKLLRSMVLHASAERGVILLARNDVLYVEAEGGASDKDSDLCVFEGAVSIDHFDRLPMTIIKFVQRTAKMLVLQDARTDARFANDPFIINGQIHSVMCLPIMRQGHMIGIVYLEHASVPRLFTEEQLRIVSILGAQAAISIENAYLYETLEVHIKERTDELQESNQTLRETNDRLLHSEAVRRQMISDISHDLRTPLASIQGYIEAVLEGVATPSDANKYLSIARDRSMQMGHLIQDLLDLSKFDENQGRLQKEMVSLLDLVHAFVRRHEFDVLHAGLRFELALDPILQAMDIVDWDHVIPENEIFVHVDIRRIDQVFSNLVTNAIRHTSAGGRVRIGVWLCADLAGNPADSGGAAAFVCFKVEDTGSGISAGDLPYIFERFYKVDRSRSRDASGSGLGLAISKAIVESHGGRVWANSRVNAGSTFFVALPIAASVMEPSDDWTSDPVLIPILPSGSDAAPIER